MTTTRRLTLASVAGFVLAWTVISFAVAAAVFDDSSQSVNAMLGVALGLASAWFELSLFPRRGLRLAPIPAIALRTAFYVGVTAVVLVATFGLGARESTRTGLVEAYTSDAFWGFVTQPDNAVVLGLVALASVLVNGARQVRLVLGPGTLSALMVGRYRVPVREERAFLFLDLTDSTGLAQRLGPDRYHAFKNDFFADVAAPILASGGRIYQYVGDEVVVTWRVRDGRLPGNPVEMVFRLDEAVARRKDHYVQAYGEAPAYKAGLHVGEVVTAEVGQIKKDIVHTGDAVNVTARIEGQCHALGARLLASEAALALAPLPDGVEAEEVGLVELRGRAGAIRLYRVGPLAPEGSLADATGSAEDAPVPTDTHRDAARLTVTTRSVVTACYPRTTTAPASAAPLPRWTCRRRAVGRERRAGPEHRPLGDEGHGRDRRRQDARSRDDCDDHAAEVGGGIERVQPDRADAQACEIRKATA